MEILNNFDFNSRPSRSRYEAVADALINQGADAVKLVRGVDFPPSVKIDSVQGGVSTYIRENHDKSARTRVLDDDTLVVGINPNPRRRAARPKGKKVAVAA